MAKKRTYTFVRGALPSIVWNPLKKNALAEFCDPDSKKVTGIFTTTDKEVADKLRGMGYKEKKDFPDGAPKGGFEPIDPEPPNHITPGGPVPQKKTDIEVEEVKDETVTGKTLPEEDIDKKVLRRRK